MTAKIKLNAASGGGSFSLQAPSSSSNDRVFTLPDVADATMATVNGVQIIDKFRVHTSFQGNADPVQNLERSDTTTMNFPFGSGMTENSGIFTFPTTGFYLIEFQCNFFYAGNEREIIINIDVSSNSGTNYTQSAISRSFVSQQEGTNTHFFIIASCVVDVTNASTFRAKGRTDLGGSTGIYTQGNSNASETFFRFTRLGDT